MKLPNVHVAVVDESKIRGYLLNAEHRFALTRLSLTEILEGALARGMLHRYPRLFEH